MLCQSSRCRLLRVRQGCSCDSRGSRFLGCHSIFWKLAPPRHSLPPSARYSRRSWCRCWIRCPRHLWLHPRSIGMSQEIKKLDGKVPQGDIRTLWDNYTFDMKLVNPSNKRKFSVIVVGTGLAGASAAATLAELGYKVDAFCISDSPRRAHSIAAQGGVNAAKNYPND